MYNIGNNDTKKIIILLTEYCLRSTKNSCHWKLKAPCIIAFQDSSNYGLVDTIISVSSQFCYKSTRQMGKGQNRTTLRQQYYGLTWLKLYDPAKADIFLVVASLLPKVLDEVMTGITSVCFCRLRVNGTQGRLCLMCYLTINEQGWVSYEEYYYGDRGDLHNSS